MKLKKYLLAFMILALSARAQASQDEFHRLMPLSQESATWTARMQSSANYLIDVLIKAHQTKLGNFDLLELKKQIAEVHWRALSSLTSIIAGPEGARSTALYSVEETTVIVSPGEWQLTDEGPQPMISFHEALGALGYSDEKYQISVCMGVLSLLGLANSNASIPDNKTVSDGLNFLAPILKQNSILFGSARRTDTPFYVIAAGGGGVTSTGGGGDHYGITMKFMVATALYKIWPLSNHGRLSFVKVFGAILNSEIERTQDNIALGKPLIDNTHIQYDGDNLKILIPKNSAIIDPRHHSIAGDYAGYLCNEIIEFMQKK